MENYFVNFAFEKAINDYLISKNNVNGVVYNSFLVVTIRSLILIYGETEIINAYNNRDEVSLHALFLKFRFSNVKLGKFFSDIEMFASNDHYNVVPNLYFINIQKFLIDMYMCKKLYDNVTPTDRINFSNFLYSPDNSNPLIISYNYLHSKDNCEIISYFQQQDVMNVKVEVVEPKVLLAPEAYKVINKSYTDVCLLSALDVKKINDEVYGSLNVDKEAVNFEYLYELALFNFYSKKKNKNKKSGTEGFASIFFVIGSILLIMSVLFIFSLFF